MRKICRAIFESLSITSFLFKFIFSFNILYLAAIFNPAAQEVVFSENFDNVNGLQPWSPFFAGGWFHESPLNLLQSVEGKGKVLRVNHPKGSVGSESGIGNYRISLDSAYTELYLSWEYFLPSSFDFGVVNDVGGGKFFGGLAGGSMPAIPNNDGTDLDGWASIMIFKDGTYRTYNYFKGTLYTVDGWPNGSHVANIVKGEWRRITIRAKVNDGDQANGLFEVFDNDLLVFQQTNAKMVNWAHPEYLIEHIYLNVFFGGGSVSPIDQYMMFDNLIAFYYPRGSSGYRSGPSERGRVIQVPAAGSYHPVPPNRFRSTVYRDASGTINSHCAFFQPVEHPSGFETSTIEVPGASQISINVTKFDYDRGVTALGSMQILKIYQGIGANRVLLKTLQSGVNTISPQTIVVSGNSATIEWQAGQGNHGGFSLMYTSDGTGSGTNYSCNNYVAAQGGIPLAIPNVPGAPKATSVTGNQITIQWADQSDNESWFEIERKGPDASTQIKNSNVPVNETSFTDTGLQPGSLYYYRIRAYNVLSGASEWTGVLEVKTVEPVPAAPSDLTVLNSTHNAVAIKWNDNSSNESWFILERHGPDDMEIVKSIQVSAGITTFNDVNLKSDALYSYSIKAYNSSSGYSASSNVINIRTAQAPPLAPSSLVADSVGYSTVILKWTDNSTDEAWFEIERSGPNDNSLIQVISVGSDLTTFTDVGLKVNSQYKYKIRAVKQSLASEYSNSINVITKNLSLPDAPSELHAKNYTNQSVTLRWKDNSTNENGFILKRSLATDSSNYVVIGLKANDTIYTDIGLTPSKSYLYTVQAINEAGPSAYSNENIAVTLSNAEIKRIRKNLIAYYNFNFIPGYNIRDLSGYKDALDVKVLYTASVKWDEDSKLHIISNTEIKSQVPAKKIVDAVKKTDALTVECWIKPDEPEITGISRIISIGADDENAGFVLDQQFDITGDKKSFVYSTRLQTVSTIQSGFPQLIQNDKCEYINLNHIVYVRDSAGYETLYINGRKSAEGFRPSNLNCWDESFYLRFGNEKDLVHGWNGEFYMVAIYDRALTASEIKTNFNAQAIDFVDDEVSQIELSVFPNPVKDHATIKLDPVELNGYLQPTRLQVLDSYGITRYEEIVFNRETSFTKYLDMSGYRKGIYFLRVISGNTYKTNKLIIQ